MTLSVIGGSSIIGVTRRSCDVVVVGSGGGGAPTALELASAGLDVIILEAGPWVKPEEFSQRVLDSVRRVYVDKGGQQTANGLVAILQGSCVGGSTVVNAEVCFPIPDHVLSEWSRDYGVRGMDPATMAPVFDEVMTHINATTNTEHYMNAGKLVRAGFDALGLDAQPAKRSVKGCKGCNYCFFGCAYGCKQSMDQSYLPRAVAAGATLYDEARVETIDRDGGLVRGVTARTPYGSLKVEASAVVLACGAIATPLLLQDNGLGGPKVGHHLALHPVLGPFGFYDEEHDQSPNAMIPFYSKAYEQEGFLLEVFSTPLEFFAPFVPGFGAEHRALVRDMYVTAALAPSCATARVPGGSIATRRDARSSITISPLTSWPASAEPYAGSPRSTSRPARARSCCRRWTSRC